MAPPRQRVLAQRRQAGTDVLPRARRGDDDDVEHTGLGVRDRHGRRLELMGGHDGPRTLHDARPPPVRGGPPSSGSERAELAAHAGRVYAQSVDGVTGQATARPEDPVRAPEPPQSGPPALVGPRRRPGGAVGVLRDPVLAGRLTRLTTLAARARIRRRFLVDAGMLGLGAVIAGFYDLSITREGLPWAILFVVLTFVNLKARGLYAARLRASPLDDLSRILAATSTAAILVVGARVAANSVNGASVQAVRLWVASTILLSAGRLAIAAVVARRQRAGVGQLRTLIIGADAVGAQIARRLTDQPELGLRAVGFVDERSGAAAGHAAGGPPLLGTPSDLEAVVHGHGIRHVIVGFAAVPPHRLTAAVRTCRRLGVGVSTVPRLYEDVNTRLEVEHLGGIPLLSSRPSDLHGWQCGSSTASTARSPRCCSSCSRRCCSSSPWRSGSARPARSSTASRG